MVVKLHFFLVKVVHLPGVLEYMQSSTYRCALFGIVSLHRHGSGDLATVVPGHDGMGWDDSGKYVCLISEANTKF